MIKNPHAMILGTGKAVPERVLTNADLEKMVDTSDRWIVERTGIRERRIVEPGTPLSALAVPAARRALEESGTDPGDLELIIVGTVTGDMKFPATACFVQEQLGASRAVAFDLSAACSGFIFSLSTAQALMLAQGYKRALVIGGDVLTSMVDWRDRDTCVLFGDGAGAAVLGPADGTRGLLDFVLCSDGRFANSLYNAGCGSLNPPTAENIAGGIHAIRMEGREVFRNAVVSMAQALQTVLDRSGVAVEDVDLFIPHQANLRIVEAVGKRLNLDGAKIYANVEKYGNTSAASVPIALDEARRSGRVGPGSLVALFTFGAGFTWGACLMRL